MYSFFFLCFCNLSSPRSNRWWKRFTIIHVDWEQRHIKHSPSYKIWINYIAGLLIAYYSTYTYYASKGLHLLIFTIEKWNNKCNVFLVQPSKSVLPRITPSLPMILQIYGTSQYDTRVYWPFSQHSNIHNRFKTHTHTRALMHVTVSS